MTIVFRMFMTAVILIAGVNIYAQGGGAASSGRDDAQEQFSSLQSKSWKIRRDEAYRETTEIVYEDKLKNQAKQISISEFSPPDRRRYSTSVELDGKTSRYESIIIGDQIFSRKDGGKWSTEKLKTTSGAGAGSSQTKFIEKTILDGRPVTVFEDDWGTYFDGKSRSGTTRYWFTDDGYLLKSVEKRRAEGDSPAATVTSLYEYDPNIKIEAPVIK